MPEMPRFRQAPPIEWTAASDPELDCTDSEPLTDMIDNCLRTVLDVVMIIRCECERQAVDSLKRVWGWNEINRFCYFRFTESSNFHGTHPADPAGWVGLGCGFPRLSPQVSTEKQNEERRVYR